MRAVPTGFEGDREAKRHRWQFGIWSRSNFSSNSSLDWTHSEATEALYSHGFSGNWADCRPRISETPVPNC